MKRKCPFCTREFSKAEHLERHIRSHTKEKPFACQHCGRKYGRNDSLLRHVRDQHPSHSRDNKDQDTERTSTLPADVVKLSGKSTNIENDPPVQVTQSVASTSVMVDFNAVIPESFPDLDVRDDSTTAGESWLFTPDQDSILAGSVNTGVAGLFTYGDLDSYVHDWPFVLEHNPDIDLAANVVTTNNSKPIVDLQRAWYTHLDVDDDQAGAVSGYATPIPRQNVVDDNYRQSLHRRLQIRSVDDQSLPSVDFLNLCVRYYFKRFHPIFPVIHAPTFRPSKRNAVLLLSICSIGSLLTGHPSAIHHGIQLFERLHKAILNHWETLMRRGSEEALAMIQASLLGQTFGLLSGQPKHLVLVDAFHGTVVSWARREKMFQMQHSLQPDCPNLEHKWRHWVRTEEKIRLALGLRIHDAEIANVLHHETLLPSSSRASHAASDALFSASNARDWISLHKEYAVDSVVTTPQGSPGFTLSETLSQRLLSIKEHSQFSVYAALQDVSSAIIEAKINCSFSPTFVDEIERCLITTHKRHLHGSQFEPLRTCTILLWHFIFISLHADLELLERSIGRDGSNIDMSDTSQVREWANSKSAKRCVAHATIIKENLNCFPLSFEPAIHVPRVMFFSAICLFCYSKYTDHESGVNAHPNLSFPELQILDGPSSLASSREAKSNNYPPDAEMGILYGLVDLLQRIGHWENSRKFASILGLLLQAEAG